MPDVNTQKLMSQRKMTEYKYNVIRDLQKEGGKARSIRLATGISESTQSVIRHSTSFDNYRVLMHQRNIKTDQNFEKKREQQSLLEQLPNNNISKEDASSLIEAVNTLNKTLKPIAEFIKSIEEERKAEEKTSPVKIEKKKVEKKKRKFFMLGRHRRTS